MDITLNVSGATIRGTPGACIVSGNTEYFIELAYGDDWRRYRTKRASITFVGDDGNTEVTREGIGSTILLPRIPSCLAVRIQLFGEADTERDLPTLQTAPYSIECRSSVLDLGSVDYEPPFDTYNACMDYINGKITGRYDSAELAAKLAAITAHTVIAAATFPSVGYRRAIAALSTETRITGEIRWPESGEQESETIVQIDTGMIAANTLTITTSALRDDFVLPGGVPAAECSVTLRKSRLPDRDLKKAEISLTFEIMQENGQWYKVPLGVYTIASIGDDTAAGTPVTAYDDMRKLDDLLHTAGFVHGKPYSPQQIIQILAHEAGIAYEGEVDFDARYANNGVALNTYGYVVAYVGGSAKWVEIYSGITQDMTDEEIEDLITRQHSVQYKGHVTYKTDLPDTAELHDAYAVMYGGPMYIASDTVIAAGTARDTLMHTVTTLGAFACIDRNRKLQIIPITHKTVPDVELPPGKIIRQRINRSEYRTFRIQTVTDYISSEGNLESTMRRSSTMWDDGVSAMLPQDPLWTTLDSDDQLDDITLQIDRIADALDPVTFRPAQAEMYGDPSISLGDWLGLSGVVFPALSTVWKYRGSQTIYSGGADAIAGQQHTQLDKTMYAGKLAASTMAEDTWRKLYKHLMRTYSGLNTFRYSEIEHYHYSELEGDDDT